MKKFTCPYCYEKHQINTCNMKCSYNVAGTNINCAKDVKKDGSGYIPTEKKKSCFQNCTLARKSIYCNLVNKEIPSDFLRTDGFSIALVGAKASGKSNYIGVLVEEIKRKMTGSFNCSINITCSEESNTYYNSHYYRPLYINKLVVDATSQDDIPPLIFPIRFMNRISKQVATLTFYDTAGENLDSPDKMVVNNKYIPNANGIILLLDPLQIPAVREKLKGKITLPAQNTDISEILSRIVQNIRDVRNIKGKIKIPIALAFTKLDTLESFNIIKEDSSLRNESEHLKKGVFSMEDFENVNLEIKDILENYYNSELEQLLKNFSNYAFFALSSLGASPIGTKLSKEITPKRVLDPLLWILAENKYIKKVKY